MVFATEGQIKYICSLARQLGYDHENYDFDLMTREQASAIIDLLSDEMEG
ncbi:MAG: hypothetical protein H6Q73_908 [Firmicutes bacterium]|nr:hypothetical protein [Bacillota bacterium]